MCLCLSFRLSARHVAGNGKEAGSLQVRVLNIFRGPRYVFGPLRSLAISGTLYAVRPISPPAPPRRRPCDGCRIAKRIRLIDFHHRPRSVCVIYDRSSRTSLDR